MKTTFMLAGVSLLMIASQAQAAVGVVPVREVRVISVEGCGIPPRDGGSCQAPKLLTVTFVVPSGNAECHQYAASVARNGRNSVLTIREFAVRRVCTSPEQKNYTVQVGVTGAENIQGSLSIANPTYVESFFRM